MTLAEWLHYAYPRSNRHPQYDRSGYVTVFLSPVKGWNAELLTLSDYVFYANDREGVILKPREKDNGKG